MPNYPQRSKSNGDKKKLEKIKIKRRWYPGIYANDRPPPAPPSIRPFHPSILPPFLHSLVPSQPPFYSVHVTTPRYYPVSLRSRISKSRNRMEEKREQKKKREDQGKVWSKPKISPTSMMPLIAFTHHSEFSPCLRRRVHKHIRNLASCVALPMMSNKDRTKGK